MLPARTLILTLALSQAQAMACTGDWAWFVAKSTGTNWSTESGKAASVQILGQNITIELNDSEGLRHKLTGVKSGNVVNVKMSTSETDFYDYPLRGKYSRRVWKQSSQESKGREYIELVGSGVVVGLSCEIRPPSSLGKM